MPAVERPGSSRALPLLSLAWAHKLGDDLSGEIWEDQKLWTETAATTGLTATWWESGSACLIAHLDKLTAVLVTVGTT